MDKSDNTVIGVVSKKYIDYYNYELLEDVKSNFPRIYNNYEVAESFMINTKLYLRVLSNDIKKGIINSNNGVAKDISRIGLQLTNSLVGDSSVKIDYFILRLLCSNGLVIESSRNSKRVIHSGKMETFKERLKEAIKPMIKELKTIPQMIQTLVEIQYDPMIIVELGGAERVYNIIPLEEKENQKRKRLIKNEEELKKFDYETIKNYPNKYGGELSSRIFNTYLRNNQSMFDFINVFTEYANKKEKDLKKRVLIEENTGKFVNWVLDKKVKINKANNDKTSQMTIWEINE